MGIKLTSALFLLCILTLAFTFEINNDECSNNFASYTASFDYKKQGADWPEELCQKGKTQSPIKIISKDVPESDDIKFSLDCNDITTGNINLDGSDLSIKFDGCKSVLTVKDSKTEWKSEEIRFHSPSEHIVDDTNEEVEMQVLFRSTTDQSKILFFAMMFELLEGATDNSFIQSLQLSDIQKQKTKILTDVKLKDKADMYVSKEMFVYKGSLTTPPCDENVWWVIPDYYEKISTNQKKIFYQLWKDNKDFADGNGNNRLIQNKDSIEIFKINIDSSKKPLPLWAVILLIAGGVVLLVIIIALFAYYCRKPSAPPSKAEERGKYKKQVNDNESSSFSFL